MSAAVSQAIPSLMDQAVKAHMTGRVPQAESLYRCVLEMSPGHAQATQYLGVLLFQQGRNEEGVALLEAGVAAEPNDSEAWSNLGNAYRTLSRFDDAIEALKKAIELNPSNAVAHGTLSACLRREGTLSDSIEHARQAIRLHPSLAQAHLNLGNSLLDSGDAAGAIVAFEQALYTNPMFLEAHQSLLFALHNSDRHSAGDIHEAAKRLGGLFPDVKPAIPDGPLKTIAFLSGDFRKHPVAYFLEPVLRSLDRSRFHIVLLSSSKRKDRWSERLSSLASSWHDVGDLSADALRELTASLHVDVLVDLAGHTASNRADGIAKRLAPVQVSWLGYSGTTGIPTMDMVLADEVLAPESDASLFTERIARLPHSAFCFDPARIETPVSPSPCEQTGYVTFGSFNNLSKLSPSIVALWADILKRAKSSRLVLKSLHLGEERIAHRLRQQFVLRGIDVSRLSISGYLDEEDHFAAYSSVDIALDPCPYTGATTSVEALHMGVPLVTLLGDRYAGRMSASILKAVGRGEWVATTKSQYVEKAVDLASDMSQLAPVRAGLRAEVAASPLCRPGQFAQDFTDTLETIWSHAQNSR